MIMEFRISSNASWWTFAHTHQYAREIGSLLGTLLSVLTLTKMQQRESIALPSVGHLYPWHHRLPLLGNATPSTAGLSVNHVHLSPAISFTSAQGKPLPSSKISFMISFFPPPVATNAILSPAVTTGSASVILVGGGFGESSMGRTQPLVSRNRGWPGTSCKYARPARSPAAGGQRGAA
jgi:hypothetical protein